MLTLKIALVSVISAANQAL